MKCIQRLGNLDGNLEKVICCRVDVVTVNVIFGVQTLKTKIKIIKYAYKLLNRNYFITISDTN